MTQEEKAQQYGNLLNQHTRISNMISEIKGQDIELNPKQLGKIKELQNQQVLIMNTINRLLS
jgi:hypothetical protein